MANLNAGLYTLEVHYKSPVPINNPANRDWQGAVLQVMWFKDAHAVSDGINCYQPQLLLITTTIGVLLQILKLF